MCHMNISNIYFSPNGETKKIAVYYYEKLGGTLVDFTAQSSRDTYDFKILHDLVILSIPVYSQNIPKPLRSILKMIKSTYVLINLTYGGFSYGNVLNETSKKLLSSTLIGYSITPVSHAYLESQIAIDLAKYDVLIQRIQNTDFHPVKPIFKIKNIFASVFEKRRTKMNYQLLFHPDRCIYCNQCILECPTQSINDAIQFKDGCILCGHCVHICPTQAIEAHQSIYLKHYLKNKQKTSVIIR